MLKKNNVIFVLVASVVLLAVFSLGYNIGYHYVDENMRLRVTESETIANNCVKKINGWCDNKRFRLVDCGDDLQVCVCMSQRDVQALRHK